MASVYGAFHYYPGGVTDGATTVDGNIICARKKVGKMAACTTYNALSTTTKDLVRTNSSQKMQPGGKITTTLRT
jgi:hypothetical protein